MEIAIPQSPCDLHTIDELDLVGRWLDGCSQSFEVLVLRYRPRLLRALYARCNGSVADAEDITQEALTRAFRERDRFDSRFRFSTWLFTIAFRLATDHRRRLKRIRWSPLEAGNEPFARPSGSDLVESADHADNLWKSARRVLNSDQYTAMWLKYGEDLSIEEIARVMRKTQIGIRVLLHRSRGRMVELVGSRRSTDGQGGV